MDRKLIQQCLCCTQSQLRQPLELLFILKSSPSDSFLCCYYYGKFCTQKSTLTSMYQEPSPSPPISHTHGHVAASTTPSSGPIVHYYGPNPRRHLIPPINMSACRSKSQGLCFPSMTHNTTFAPNGRNELLWGSTGTTDSGHLHGLPPVSHSDGPHLLPPTPAPLRSHWLPCSAPNTPTASSLGLAVTPARCSSPRGTQSPFPCPLSLAQRDLL